MFYRKVYALIRAYGKYVMLRIERAYHNLSSV